MRSRSSGPVLGAALLLLFATAPVAAQVPRPRSRTWVADEAAQKKRREDAIRLHDEARDLYEAGEYRRAVGKLEQAWQLDPEGKELVYNLALIHEKLGELDAAQRYYTRYLELESDPAQQEKTHKALKRMEGARKDVPTARPGGAGEKPAPLAPPVAESPSGATGPPAFTGAPLAPGEGARPIGPGVWLSGGLAVGVFMVGNAFAISAVVTNPGEEATTGGQVGIDDLRADAESAHQRAIIADVAFLVAAVATGAAVYLYLSTPARPARAGLHGAPPRVGPRGFEVHF